MDSKQRQQLKKYVDLIIGRWQLIAICLLLSVGGAVLILILHRTIRKKR